MPSLQYCQWETGKIADPGMRVLSLTPTTLRKPYRVSRGNLCTFAPPTIMRVDGHWF